LFVRYIDLTAEEEEDDVHDFEVYNRLVSQREEEIIELLSDGDEEVPRRVVAKRRLDHS
jgi:hypothetical protein